MPHSSFNTHMFLHLLNLNGHSLLFLPEAGLSSGLRLLHYPLSLFKYGWQSRWPGQHGVVQGEVGGREGVDIQQVGQPLQRGLRERERYMFVYCSSL